MREFAKLSALKDGDLITVDGGFTCVAEGTIRQVYMEDNCLCFRCNDGSHALDGQLDDDGETLVGVYAYTRK